MPVRANRDHVITEHGCVLWRGPVDSAGRPITREKGRQLQVPRWLFAEHHRLDMQPKWRVRAARVCGTDGCVAPGHATFARPRTVMQTNRVPPRLFRSILESLKTDDEIVIDTGRFERTTCPRERFDEWAEVYGVQYSTVLAAWSELVRNDWNRRHRESKA